MMASLVFADWYPFLSMPAIILRPGEKRMPEGDLIIAPQFCFGPYRLDFLIMGHSADGQQKWVNVECDGEEYHNTTKAQWDADDERDKFLRASGITVVRFSGTELYNDASGCASEAALELIRWRWQQWSKREALAAA